MARSWKDVKADKARRDAAAGRDVKLARKDAHNRTQASVLGFRLAQSRGRQGLSQSEARPAWASAGPGSAGSNAAMSTSEIDRTTATA
ncbi:hypothetical protein AB0425_14250 [Actinosynnema sp. NPDC051121]|nr:hypothetical protein [Saccharothrix sp.]